MKSSRKERKKKERKERKKKEREPKKSTGRDGGLTKSEQDKHLERKRKKNFHIQEQWKFSLSSSGVTPQHPVLVLVFKQ
jgi:hypothetical protein